MPLISPFGAHPLGKLLQDTGAETLEIRASVPTMLGAPSVVARQRTQIRVDVPTLLGAPSVVARQRTQIRASVPTMLGAPSVAVQITTYEVRGTTKDNDVLVNRRVRVYRRDTGVLLGEADSVNGKVRVPTDAFNGEVFIVSIDLDAGATDFVPYVANRVIPVIVDDTAVW